MSVVTFSHCCRCNASQNVTEMWTKPGRGYLCETCTNPPPSPSDELTKSRYKADAEQAWRISLVNEVSRLERENTVLVLALRASMWNDELATLRREAQRRECDQWRDKHAEAIELATRTEDTSDGTKTEKRA